MFLFEQAVSLVGSRSQALTSLLGIMLSGSLPASELASGATRASLTPGSLLAIYSSGWDVLFVIGLTCAQPGVRPGVLKSLVRSPA